MKSFLRFLARCCYAAIFIYSGQDVARNPGGRVKAAERIHVPQPELAVRLNAVVMVLAGLALALNLRPRWASAALAAVLVPTTVAGHAFWSEQDPQRRIGQRTHFLKNLAMFGGFLLLSLEEENAVCES